MRHAIIQANQVRLRPILMTTLSIVARLIPTAMGIGAGATQRSAIAVTIIGGQMLCLLLTLVMTPAVYSLLADLAGNRIVQRVFQISRLRGAKEPNTRLEHSDISKRLNEKKIRYWRCKRNVDRVLDIQWTSALTHE